jgi:hypothetical protein
MNEVCPHKASNLTTQADDSKKYKALTSSYPAEMSRSSFTKTISPHTSKKNATPHLSACKPNTVHLLRATLSTLHLTHVALLPIQHTTPTPTHHPFPQTLVLPSTSPFFPYPMNTTCPCTYPLLGHITILHPPPTQTTIPPTQYHSPE